MEIEKKNSVAALMWNGTRTKLDVLSVDNRLCFRGESPTTGNYEFFLRIDSLESLETIMNIMETMGL